MNKRKNSKVLLVIVVCLLVYSGYILVQQERKIHAQDKQIEEIKASIDDEKGTQEELKKQSEIVGSDEYIEKIAREKLGMVKQGEKVFVDINK